MNVERKMEMESHHLGNTVAVIHTGKKYAWRQLSEIDKEWPHQAQTSPVTVSSMRKGERNRTQSRPSRRHLCGVTKVKPLGMIQTNAVLQADKEAAGRCDIPAKQKQSLGLSMRKCYKHMPEDALQNDWPIISQVLRSQRSKIKQLFTIERGYTGTTPDVAQTMRP